MYDIQEDFYEVAENYPNRLIGNYIGMVSFPYGRRFSKPTDEQKQVISELVTETSDEFYSTDNIEPFIFFKYPKRSRCALHSDVIPQEKDENGAYTRKSNRQDYQ